ncbi:MAG: LolA family protein [Armatimonadota bacterium]
MIDTGIMRRAFIYGSALLIVAVVISQAQAAKITAKQALQNVSRHYEVVKDYTADAKLSMESPNIHIPETKIKIFFKKPDKIHVESKDGLAILPKQGLVMGNPVKSLLSDSKLTMTGSERIDGKDCYIILSEFQDEARTMQSRVWVDKKDWLVMRMSSNPGYGPSVEVTMKYTKVENKYWMPAYTKAQISIPPMTRPHQQPNTGKAQPTMATIKFSNYRINKGLNDSIFIQKPEGGK